VAGFGHRGARSPLLKRHTTTPIREFESSTVQIRLRGDLECLILLLDSFSVHWVRGSCVLMLLTGASRLVAFEAEAEWKSAFL